MLHYPLTEIAQFMDIAIATVRQYDRSARHRAQCTGVGELARSMLALMFPE